ncbi:MAG: phenylalanine--tRNA ligase subunit alpha, partial [Bacilli bacterium]|nr:phenylalanine--tRNA ligase subunit alpha [Bacilli bacterium]
MEDIIKNLKKEIASVKSIQDLSELKAKYLGKKGSISSLSLKMKEIANEKKKEFGMKLNKIKNEANDLLDGKREEIEKKLLDSKLKNESIDISLPGLSIPMGRPNIVEKMVEEVEEVCMSMGYDVVDGPEIEKDEYNFEMLNLPKGHPARDAQDTFYIEGEELLLRSQTSPVQIRCMLKGKGEEPIRMICPGKTYRRDDDDATHSHQFM